MALNECQSCTTKFAVGLPRCPQCRSTEFVEDGSQMAKITRNGGASDATLPDEAEADSAPQPVTEEVPAVEPEPVNEEGGEGSSPGSSSETSTETPPTPPEPSEPPTLSPARKTGSRSRKAQTESSSASGTGGGQTEATSALDGE